MTGSLSVLAAAIGSGIAVFGASMGIGKLAASAMDGMARQPSADGSIRTAMMLAAAFIEGAVMFALVICMLIVAKP
jgi:F-type H+-transporting ATPase subunit c